MRKDRGFSGFGIAEIALNGVSANIPAAYSAVPQDKLKRRMT